MNEQLLYTGRKSFVAYIRSALGTLVWMAIFGGLGSLVVWGGYPVWGAILVGLGLLAAAKGIYNLFYLRTIQWIIHEEGLMVREGILPWSKQSFDHPYETIFEAYYNFGLFAKLFGYGNCVIRRTEGNTTAESESHMHDAAKITRLINGKLKELRKAQRPVPIALPTHSHVDELRELAKLKAAGDISAGEFETLKKRIVGAAVALLLTLSLHGPALAAVNLELVASPNPPRPDELLDFELTVTNDGLFDRDDVTLLFLFPDNIKPLSNNLFDGSCPASQCVSGSQATFEIPSLRAGEGVTFSMPIFVKSAVANGTLITFSAEVVDDSVVEANDVTSVTVDAARELELALVEDRDPFAPGDLQEYTLTFGVIETSPGSPGATLSFPVPSGTTFVSATDGGLLNGGIVEWPLGNLDPGSSGERRAQFRADGLGNGSIVLASATFGDTAGNSVSHASATRVQPEIPLRLQLTASPDPARSGEILDFELTVTNDGLFSRNGVVMTMEYPDELASLSNFVFDGGCVSGSTCTPGGRARFDIGTLAGGQGRTFSMPIEVAGSTIDGTVILFEAEVRDSTGDRRESGAIVATQHAREVELALVAEHDPVPPGGAIEYVLSYGLIETSSGASGASLRLAQPAGTSFISASDGGSLVDGIVEWSLGSLNPGATGERRVTFDVDPGLDPGTIIQAEATHTDADSREVRYEAAARVLNERPLWMDVIASPDPARPGEVLDVELTVTNRGEFDRNDVVLTFEFPDEIATLSNFLFDGGCQSGSTCLPGQPAVFDIGTLSPGEGRMFSMPLEVSGAALDGTTIALETHVIDSTGDVTEAATVLAVDDTRNLDLSMSGSDEPLAAGSSFTYTMVFGTFPTGGGVPGTAMEFELPAGTQFVSASDGGVFADGIVSWPIGGLNPGAGGDRSVVVQIDPLLEPGALIEAAVRFDDASNPAEQVRFQETTRVAGPAPFDVDLEITQFFAPAGALLDYVVSVTNHSAFDRTGVVLRFETPEGVAPLSNFDFPGSCSASSCLPQETAVIDVGTLPVGETLSYPIPFEIANATPAGTVINFDALVHDDTAFMASDGVAVMVGGEFDGGRSAGAGAVSVGIGGPPLRIEKAESCDDLILTWADSCLTADDDYAIYVGTIGDFSTYSRLFCSTDGSSSKIFTPAEGVSQFYLVVPQNGVVEGSYGRDSEDAEREPSAQGCLPQMIATTCE